MISEADRIRFNIELSPWDDDDSAIEHEFELLNGREAFARAYDSYWKNIIDTVGKLDDDKITEGDLRNLVVFIKSLGLDLCRAILDERSTQIIWEAANNCEILLLRTNLYQFPWEALINPWAKSDRDFLVQKCAIIRRPRMNTPSRANESVEPVPPSQPSLVVDTLLGTKWHSEQIKDALPKLHLEYLKLRGRINVHSCAEFSCIFDHIRDKRVLALLCENDHDESGDRLRVAHGVHLTSAILESEIIDREAILFLLTCARIVPPNSAASKPPLPATIANQHGCTVVAPLIPISEYAGLFISRKILALLEWRRRTHPDQMRLHQEITRMRAGEIFGSPSRMGILSLFFGVYGRPNSYLG
jgi:hypothetical protein